VSPVEPPAEQQFFDQFFHSAPPEIDVEAIRQEWLAVQPPYRIDDRHLPLPVWARRGFAETGEGAWAKLGQDVGRIDLSRALCIYVHIPFCASRCSFCDCYSFSLRRHRSKHIEGYVTLLAQEMRLWSRLGTLAHQPVSTVHFGGGTPTVLGEAPFRRLAQGLYESFYMGPQTEWALESTSSELADEMFSTLENLGFTRLHVGVQTLQDAVRRRINRREPAAVVLDKIARAVGMGWIVSVDLICGLPGQSMEGLLGDIQALEAVGVDGFSLYELQLSSRNHRFAERYGLADRGRLINYLLTQGASRLLTARGYRKTLFNHFARERDANLYFTFPERGEDCLALGTIADGVFGDYHYRHPEYKLYCQSVSEGFPGLQGGLRRTALENRLYPLEIALLSGCIPVGLFADVLGKDRSKELFRQWRASALIEGDAQQGHLRLTANGSWFTGQMMQQLPRFAQSPRLPMAPLNV
jgi:coproporphyrinogen III oxidase-like Fe-S oxidoreductase